MTAEMLIRASALAVKLGHLERQIPSASPSQQGILQIQAQKLREELTMVLRERREWQWR